MSTEPTSSATNRVNFTASEGLQTRFFPTPDLSISISVMMMIESFQKDSSSPMPRCRISPLQSTRVPSRPLQESDFSTLMRIQHHSVARESCVTQGSCCILVITIVAWTGTRTPGPPQLLNGPLQLVFLRFGFFCLGHFPGLVGHRATLQGCIQYPEHWLNCAISGFGSIHSACRQDCPRCPPSSHFR